jgi:hypothetical protein
VTVSDIDSGTFGPQCTVEASTWHGTHVAGIILAGAEAPGTVHAAGDQGIAGVAPEALLLPVRAIGRCGGSEADLQDAILWAAGLPVDGAPPNEHPAAIINLSLSAEGPCGPEMQRVIDAAMAAGALLVSSVGNDAADASGYSPANCTGTLTVGALEHGGQRANYSNYGPYVDLSAPGGTLEEGVLSAVDSGSDQPASPTYVAYAGTSMAAPHVAGILALARALDPDLPASDLYEILFKNLAPFVASGRRFGCSIPDMCGAGAASAGRLLRALEARAPAPTVTFATPKTLSWGRAVAISAEAADRTQLTLQSLTPRVCGLSGEVVTALAVGKCRLRAHASGTILRKPVEAVASFSIFGVRPKLQATLPATLRVGYKAVAKVVTSPNLRIAVKSITPRICSTSAGGTVKALRAGTCQIRVTVGPGGKYGARTAYLQVRVHP